MLNRLGKLRKALAVATAVAAVAFAPRAEAAIIGLWAEDGGAYSVFSPVAGTHVFGDFTVTVVSAFSNSPGTPSVAILLHTETGVFNNANVTHTLSLIFGDTDYTQPAAPPNAGVRVETSAGGNVVLGSATGHAWAWLNSANSAASGTPSGTLVADFPVNLQVGGSDVTTLTSTGNPYSLIQRYDITASGGALYNTSMTTVVTPIPEPAALMLMGLGLLGFGVSRVRKLR